MTAALPSEVDIIVVGAGPTGLTLANLLGALGVRTLIVEARPTTSDMPRAIVLDDEGARTLQAAGLDGEAVAGALEGLGTRYIGADGKIIAEVGRGVREFGFPKRFFISQPELERTLARGLPKWPSVHVAFDTMLQSFVAHADHVEAALVVGGRTQTVRGRWLVACDGGRSPIRESLGVSFEGSTYGQDWIVLDLADDPEKAAITRFFCDPARPAVCVPAPAGGRRYEFMVLPGESREEVLRPEFLAKLLAPHRPWRPEDVVRATVYTFHARIASRWRAGRVLLAGDAAHLTPPFAGQGMNAGLRDASNLAWKLALEVRGAGSSSLLDTYEQERRGPCVAMIELAVLMGKVIMPASTEEVAMQRALMQLVGETPALKQYLFEMRFKPRPQYTAGALLRNEDDLPETLVGRMIPQPMVSTPDGGMRLDDALGYGFALIAQSASAAKAVAEMWHPLWDRLKPVKMNLHVQRRPAPPGFSAVSPDDLGMAAPFRTHRDQILLVRPDRYVAAAIDPSEADTVAGSLEKLLGHTASAREEPSRTHVLQGVSP